VYVLDHNWGNVYEYSPGSVVPIVSTATGSGTATFVNSAGTVYDLTGISESSLPSEGKPGGVVFPDGLFSFNITDLNPGQTVTLDIQLPSNVAVGSQYWKYQAGVGWFSMPIGSDDGDNSISITLTDGVVFVVGYIFSVTGSVNLKLGNASATLFQVQISLILVKTKLIHRKFDFFFHPICCLLQKCFILKVYISGGKVIFEK
jgi:hypothetical protein